MKSYGIKFGEDFLWHIFNPDKSDWFPESTKPAIALCIFKEYLPGLSVQIASDIQYALNFEGRDLTDNEAYRHLVLKYQIPEDEFYSKLISEEYREKAYYEFALVKQLHVTGFPTVLVQVSESKFYLLAQGYTDYETIEERLKKDRSRSNDSSIGITFLHRRSLCSCFLESCSFLQELLQSS